MPTPPYAKIQVSADGGPIQTGGLTMAGGEVIQLSAESTSAWQSALWELYVTRGAITTPAGWTYDATAERFYYAGTSPPPFTLAAASGAPAKYMPRLVVNGAQTDRSAADYVEGLVDESTAIRVLSTGGLRGVGFRETNQFDPQRGWGGELDADWALLGGGGSGNFGAGKVGARAFYATGELVEPATGPATFNNYDLGDYGILVVSANSGGLITFTGFVAPPAGESRVVQIVATPSHGGFTIADRSGSSAAANQVFVFGIGGSPMYGATIFYSHALGMWVMGSYAI